jgi:hypothetical protein
MHHTGTSDSLSFEKFKPHRKDCRKRGQRQCKRMEEDETKIQDNI